MNECPGSGTDLRNYAANWMKSMRGFPIAAKKWKSDNASFARAHYVALSSTYL